MKRTLKGWLVSVSFAAAMMMGTSVARAQDAPQNAPQNPERQPVAGTERVALGVTVDELVEVVKGWSVKKQILGKAVYNDKNEKIGKVDDVIASPERSQSWVIVGVGEYMGLKRHEVAIPVNQIKLDKERMTLPGATKDALKNMPEFQYAK